MKHMYIMPRKIKIKMIFDKYGDEMEQVFEKRPFLRVDNVLFENFFEKRPFLRVTTYFPEQVFDKQPFCVLTTFLLKTFLKKDHFRV